MCNAGAESAAEMMPLPLLLAAGRIREKPAAHIECRNVEAVFKDGLRYDPQS
jgi:hypothetical protein